MEEVLQSFAQSEGGCFPNPLRGEVNGCLGFVTVGIGILADQLAAGKELTAICVDFEELLDLYVPEPHITAQ